jgi:hypothetical protein
MNHEDALAKLQDAIRDADDLFPGRQKTLQDLLDESKTRYPNQPYLWYRGKHSVIVIGLNKAVKMTDEAYHRTLCILCGYNPDVFLSTWQLKIYAASVLINWLYTGQYDYRHNPDQPIAFKTTPLHPDSVALVQWCRDLAEQQLAAEERTALLEQGQVEMTATESSQS